MTEPRILIYDIETNQLRGKGWGPKYQSNWNSFEDPSNILSFGYRWHGEEEVTVVSLRDFKRSYARNRRDDRQLVGALHDLFEESHIRVAHNGDNFDEKTVKARMAANGFTNPSKAFTIDTKKAVRRHFRLPSNSLNDIAWYFDLGAKLQHTGLHLWDAVEAGDSDAWDMMEAYNGQDVELLDRLYTFLRDGGWIDNHPNLANIAGVRWMCPKCGDTENLHKRGQDHTKTMTYQRWHCLSCNSYSRERLSGTGPALV